MYACSDTAIGFAEGFGSKLEKQTGGNDKGTRNKDDEIKDKRNATIERSIVIIIPDKCAVDCERFLMKNSFILTG
jgi:hypothetical protein